MGIASLFSLRQMPMDLDMGNCLGYVHNEQNHDVKG